MRTVYRVIYILSALAILGMSVGFSTLPAAAPIPAPMKHYVSGDRSIGIKHPGNWKTHERSSHAVETELEYIPTQNARFTVTVDLQGSLMADIMKSTSAENSQIAGMIPGGATLTAGQKTPLETMHDAQGAQMKQDKETYPGFKDGLTLKSHIAGKEALVTECTWTAPGLFGSRPIVGRRTTVLSGDHQVSVVYGCLSEMRGVILPVFQEMQESIELDVQGGGR